MIIVLVFLIAIMVAIPFSFYANFASLNGTFVLFCKDFQDGV